MVSPIDINEKEIIEKLKENKKIVDPIIEEYLPKKVDYTFMEKMFGKTKYEYDCNAFNEAFLKPSWDLLERGGKRWRPFLLSLIYEALGGNKEDIKEILIIPELLHNGSIIIDDIEDKSEIRRGKLCIHKIYGEDIAINVGNFLYFYPFITIIRNSSLDPKIKARLYDTIIFEMIKLHIGQGTDIFWHNGRENPNIKQYLEMCGNKTGGLARLSVKIAGILANKEDKIVEKLGEIAESVGIAFQIQDDIINLKSEKFQKLKGFGEDITEGKRSLMVIHTLEKANEKDRKRLLEILNKHTKDQNEIKEAIQIMDKYGSFEFAKNKAKEIVENAWKEAEKYLDEGEAKETLKKFIFYIIEREI